MTDGTSLDSRSTTKEELSHDMDVSDYTDQEAGPKIEQQQQVVKDETLVDFDGPSDPYNPQNWSRSKKVLTTAIYSFATMCTTWASSAYVALLDASQEDSADVSPSVTTLDFIKLSSNSTNGLGPLIWAPMSEAYGRKISTITIPMFGLAVFSFATATAKDFQTIMITRFFAGAFGVAPMSNVGGILVDIWPASERGVALLTWGISVIGGALIAPVVGGALVVAQPQTGWRWTEYVTGILASIILVLGLILVSESSSPALLAAKASKLRHETKNWAIRSKSQELDISVSSMLKKYFIVPLEMMIDPICLLINIYAAFVYAIIYLAITSFPIEFAETRGWGPVTASLPFLAILIGVFFGAYINYLGQGFYRKRQAATGLGVVPEARLFSMIIGTFFFSPGLFIMGWTSGANIHWIGFCIGAACVGLGFFAIFQSSLNYLIDTYLALAASALVANMFMRSIFAAAFPLFSNPMFHNLGLDWGMSLLGFLAVAMMPIPFLFYIYGKGIRAKGKRSKVSFVA